MKSTLTDKRALRIEKKKKKMAALLEVLRLNEHDRTRSANTNNNNNPDAEAEAEPTPKRIRTNSNEQPRPLETMAAAPPPDGATTGAKKRTPKVRLREMGESALLTVPIEDRVPLFLSDIQHMLVYAQIGNHAPYSPARWCQVEKHAHLKHTNVLILENMALAHYQTHEARMPFLAAHFPLKLEIIAPGAYKADIVKNIATIPLTGTQVRKYINKYGTLEKAVNMSREVFDRVENLFPVQSAVGTVTMTSLHADDAFPRTHLLLSGWQMIEENYPLPIKGLMERKYTDYVLTKDAYEPVTDRSPMYGVDCEMVRTRSGDLELARVTITDEGMRTVYDELVKPPNAIVDYLTRYSGITPKMMRGVTKRVADVQTEIRALLPADAILVGQSLGGDLHVLKMMHPYIVDTSVIFNMTGDRMRKTKLQTLSLQFLSERIQEGAQGHCSAEDSKASLKLAKLKLRNSIHFGDAVMADVATHLHDHPELGNPNYATSMLRQATKLEKRALVVSCEELVGQYTYFTYKGEEGGGGEAVQKVTFVRARSNKSIVKKFCARAAETTFNIAHMRLDGVGGMEEAEGRYERIDEDVRRVWEMTATPGMVVVIMGGHQECGNGMAFIGIKK